MKKKFSLLPGITVLLIFVTLLCGLLAIPTFATAHDGCDNYNPYIRIDKNNGVVVDYCLNCENGPWSIANMPTATLNITDGAYIELGTEITVTETNDCLNVLHSLDDDIVLVYEGRDGTNYDKSTDMPTYPGDYTVYLTTKKMYDYYLEKGYNWYYGYSGTYSDTSNQSIFGYGKDFTVYCTHEYEFYPEDGKLRAKCTKCGTRTIYYLSLSVDNGGDMCCFSEDAFTVTDYGWTKRYGDYVLLYEGRGDTVYALSDKQPTENGTYTVSIAIKSVWENNPENIDSCRTTPIDFTIDPDLHRWEYKADGCSIVADCRDCDTAHASVTLDSAAVYENARQLDTSGLAQELFYEENWSSYSNIAHYVVMYNGKEITSYNGHSTTQYYNALIAPENSGNYVANLAILKDDATGVTGDDIIVKSEGMPFYIAGYSLSRCEVKEYGATEIAQFTKPTITDDVYYVGTLSELLWCVYNQTENMNIVLTNDIIVNPITVTDNGNISSGALVLYKWKGFGDEYEHFTGSIDGQGHTIYGIYVPETRSFCSEAGFINQGENVTVKNLTIESSYINSEAAVGAFFGAFHISNGKSAGIENCYSLYNLLTSVDEAGGFIGWLSAFNGNSNNCELSFDYCCNTSDVTSKNISGGIIGRCADGEYSITIGHIRNCQNYGKIVGDYCSGGIVGAFNIWKNRWFFVECCVNAGYIKANTYEAGIIAWLSDEFSTTQPNDHIYICHNANIGSFYSGCKNNAADILGYTYRDDYFSSGYLTLDDNYWYKGKSPYLSMEEDGIADTATKLTAKDISNGKICELWGHVENPHYNDVEVAGCETDGSKNIRCLTCDAVLKTVKTSAHGHYFQYGECIYCGEEDKNLTGSLFSQGSIWIAIAITVVLVAAAVAVALLKKRKTTSK